MNGFAANTTMINRLASAPGGVSNPPTEAQVTQYMRELTHPPKGKPQPTAQQVMQAASDITGGMIMHYSSAGRPGSGLQRQPQPARVLQGPRGQGHEFASVADAQKAAKPRAQRRRTHPARNHAAWTRARPTSGAT